jgi:hypothetical protein
VLPENPRTVSTWTPVAADDHEVAETDRERSVVQPVNGVSFCFALSSIDATDAIQLFMPVTPAWWRA